MKEIVYVEWWDHISLAQGRWISKADLDEIKVAKCKSVGWVYKQDDESITLVPHIAGEGEDADYGGDMTIHRSAIITWETLSLK